MPITPQNWSSTASLESNGVSVTIVNTQSASNNPTIHHTSNTTTQQHQMLNNSVTITPTNKNVLSDIDRRQNNNKKMDISSSITAVCEWCKERALCTRVFHKTRNFCSHACARAATSENSTKRVKLQGSTKSASVLMPEYDQDDSSSSSTSNSGSEQDMIPIKRNKLDMEQTYDWTRMLNSPNFVAANVASFKHAPVSYLWENVTVGMKVEVQNTDVDQTSYQTAFWVASVIQIQGYKVLLRFEGFGSDSSRDFYVNLCSEDIHHVGWCATKGKPLIPPRSISGKFPDWREFLVRRLTGARTLPQNFQTKVANGLKSKYELNSHLEVVDKNRISQVRLAAVQKIVGKRLHVQYFDSTEDGGFWCHEDSSLIHPVGWAKTVGHPILAPKSYNPPTLPQSAFKFPNYDNVELKEGMKLECIDPLNLSAICAATIKKVLNCGYIMIRVDCYEDSEDGFDWFCYHVTSPYIFPCGFAASNGLILTPPHGYSKDSFSWPGYLKQTTCRACPLSLLKKERVDHDLKVKMRLEAADLMDPRLICVATISQVVGRLLKIHFDGWEEEYDQWLDSTSPDIYPIGWCELVGHKLEPPRPNEAPPPQSKTKTKKGNKKKKIPYSKSKDTSDNEGKKSSSRVNKPVSSKIGTKNINRLSSGKHEMTPDLNISNPHSLQNIKDGIAEGNQVNMMNKTEGEKESGTPSDTERLPETIIPKLTGCPSMSEIESVDPQKWNANHVKEFLEINDCASHCDSFSKIDGPKLMSLTKDQIIELTGKVGPALRLDDLLGQLKRLVQASRIRNSALSK